MSISNDLNWINCLSSDALQHIKHNGFWSRPLISKKCLHWKRFVELKMVIIFKGIQTYIQILGIASPTTSQPHGHICPKIRFCCVFITNLLFHFVSPLVYLIFEATTFAEQSDTSFRVLCGLLVASFLISFLVSKSRIIEAIGDIERKIETSEWPNSCFPMVVCKFWYF